MTDREATERCGCEKRHDHLGPWWGIGLVLALLSGTWYGTIMLEQHQFDVIYERVGAIQRQLECPPTETFVTDDEGKEYCLDTQEPQP